LPWGAEQEFVCVAMTMDSKKKQSIEVR